MIKHLLLPAFLLAMTTSAFAYTDDELMHALVGSWGDQENCPGAVLVFNLDGTFSSQSSPGAAERRGKFEVKDGKLAGTAEDGTEMPVVTLIYDGVGFTFKDDAGMTNQLFSCPP